MTAPIDLYYWPTPNGWKISIALEEMGLPYTTHLVNIGAGEQFAPEFLKIAPNNRMPAIVDPDGPDGAPVSIFESGAILQYLARKTGQFGGTTEREMIAVQEWLMWQMGGLGPMAGQAHHFLKYVMEETMPLEDAGWMILTKRLMLCFFGLALANELIWRFASTETWVYFKTFGLTAAVFVFFMSQGKLFQTYGLEKDKA